ncbi:deaminase domain-containing protein [Purpureocillium lilacinum]|uniref:Deaminase domain-containing protein n=1 Tax=Purpureocillium lilacinum TaxID=33203 RepID=A0A179FKQ1_PURLI|nr:deaminase domain-containing protein [Purpureocillium lilacinum]
MQGETGGLVKERAPRARCLECAAPNAGRAPSHHQSSSRVSTSCGVLFPCEVPLAELFHGPATYFIPSSVAPRRSVRNKSLTAESIVGRMTRKQGHIQELRSFAEDLQVFDLNGRTRKQYQRSSFSTVVHSEVSLLNWLEWNGGTDPSRFFHGWAYIGTREPTCRLCSYYFQGHPSTVEYRSSHGNLYASWRLPDVLRRQGSAAVQARTPMYDRILQRVRQDATDMLRCKVRPSYKGHDSNTFSATVGLKEHWTAVDGLDYFPPLHKDTGPAEVDRGAAGDSATSQQAGHQTRQTKSTKQRHRATWQCPLCPKRFTRGYNLRSHTRNHSGERPF